MQLPVLVPAAMPKGHLLPAYVGGSTVWNVTKCSAGGGLSLVALAGGGGRQQHRGCEGEEVWASPVQRDPDAGRASRPGAIWRVEVYQAGPRAWWAAAGPGGAAGVGGHGGHARGAEAARRTIPADAPVSDSGAL